MEKEERRHKEGYEEKEERRHKEVRKEETKGNVFSLPNGKNYHKEKCFF